MQHQFHFTSILHQRHLRCVISIIVIGIFLTILACNLIVNITTKGKTFDRVAYVPCCEYGLLLGTSPITPSGEHNWNFDNRVKAAAELYRTGHVSYIIASGGDYRTTQEIGCDEPAAMRDSLVAYGVPIECILLDYEGVRTYNSILKAKNYYHADSIIIISQEAHNQRAIYMAEHAGIYAVGYNAAPSPSFWNRLKNGIRESLARVKIFVNFLIWDVDN